MSDWITNLGTGLFVAIVTSVVTVQLSLKSFVSQRWWERKAQAYSQILEQLSYTEHYESIYLDVIEEFGDTNTDRLKERGEEAGRAGRALRRAAAVGKFVISEKAAEALGNLHERDHPDLDIHDAVTASLDRTQRCMKAIREEAERDLSPSRFGFWR